MTTAGAQETPAPPKAQETPPPFMDHGTDVPGGRGIPVPNVIISEKSHPAHGTVFTARLNKSAYWQSAYWRAEVSRVGEDAAFADWLRLTYPDAYRKHFGLKKPDPSMNDKQMNRGMPM